jgi:beta-carotene hydroxylase
MYAALVGNVALYRSAPLPLPLHVLLAAAAVHLAFTVWHEAVHHNVTRRAWTNDLVGIAGMFPYMTPYFMQKWIHLEHHARLNQRDDPNYSYIDGPFWKIPLRYPRALRYARTVLRTDPRTPGQRLGDAMFLIAVGAVYAAAWWFDMLSDVLLLWLLPVLLAKIVMDWYINYLPHVGLPADRFRGTRVVDVPWLTPLILAHNYHAIHHLWPTIPWHGYRGVFKRKRAYLETHGVPIERRVFERRYPAPTLAPQESVSH